jgi:hypothetical protein
MFELETTTKTIRKESYYTFLFIILFLWSIKLYFIAYITMILGCTLVLAYEESEDEKDHMEG